MERMAARVYCAVLLCLAGCWSSTEAAPGLNNTGEIHVLLITQHGKMQQVPYKKKAYRRPVKDEFCWQHQFK